MVEANYGGMIQGMVGMIALCLLSACAPVSEPLMALWRSPTPTPTATPTATLTPTATPTPTATLTPTPQPPTLLLQAEPLAAQQGQTVLVRVTLDRAATLNGDFDGQSLTFFYDSPTEAWALVAVPPWSALGPRPLLVEAVAPEGQRVWQEVSVSVQESAFAVQQIDVPPDQGELLRPGLRPAEDRYLDRLFQPASPQPLWQGTFLLPAEGVRSSPFGARRSYQGGPLVGYHGGLDIAAPEGTPVHAAAPGTVLLAEPLFIRGNVVVLDHGVGVHTLYFHLAELSVAAGQTVTQGQQLGLMGSTGLSTGAHLHWEVRVGGIFVDPDEWLTRPFR